MQDAKEFYTVNHANRKGRICILIRKIYYNNYLFIIRSIVIIIVIMIAMRNIQGFNLRYFCEENERKNSENLKRKLASLSLFWYGGARLINSGTIGWYK